VDDRLRAIKFDRPGRIPLSAGILPAAWMTHRRALYDVVHRHPVIFGNAYAQEPDYDAVGGTYATGEHTDAWGCVWSNIHAGMEAFVTGHPYPTRESVRNMSPPATDTGFPHGFMYLRLLDLRGFEEAMTDFAEEPLELRLLISAVLAYNLRQAGLRLSEMESRGGGSAPSATGATFGRHGCAGGKIVVFGDDLGMQSGLAIGAARWRKYLKPCYKAIYEPFKKAGHYVYMHTDGWILDIIPDLAECGVDVINPQVRANGIDNLARVCRGRYCLDLDLDRQLFPFCTPVECDRHVQETVDKLATPEGGLWLKAEIGPDVPLANVEAIFTAMEKYGGY